MNGDRPLARGNRVGAPAWSVVEPLLDEALYQPTEVRAEWVRANAANQAIADEVLALLSGGDRKGILDAELPINLIAPELLADVSDRLAAALDGRYLIDAVLGQGGTATVFLAHELKHERPVVLKVLRPEIARWIGAERFLAEIQILARLSHPHILALIDSGEADGLLYYVMPYVGGETLREQLHHGAVPLDEALSQLRNVAAALAHAHEQRLVHRDLKPENILIVTGHAFLMDFGIAEARPEIRDGDVSVKGPVIGTPAYMAPEQAAGRPADFRADLYSWGLVAVESLLGRAGSASDLPKSVPVALRRLIAQCLEEEPAKRPVDGAELVARLDSIAEHPLNVGRRYTWIPAVVAVVLAALSVFALIRSRSPALATVDGPVMVAPLTNETGDTSLSVWGRMAGDWMTQGLHETGRVGVVPWPVALQASTAIRDRGDRDPIQSLAGETGAHTLVTGTYYLSGGVIRFQAQVTDARSGTVLAALPAIDVPRDSIRAGIQQMRDRMMAVFAIRNDQRLSNLPGLIDRPPTYEAYRLFEHGLERFTALDYPPASEAFVDAWKHDTTFTIALVYAATAYLNRSQYQRADSVVKALRAGATRLNRYHELMLRYTEAILAGDGMGALELARQAAATAPGGRAQYNLATIALSVGRVDEALTTMREIDPDRGVLKGWSPYWFVLAQAEHLKGQFGRESKTAAEVRRRYPDSRAGWVNQVRALAAAGNLAAVDSIVASASALPPDTYWSQGAMLVIIGEELDAHGHPGALGYYRRAITWLGNQLARDPSNRAHRYWMGSVQLDRGTPAGAAPYFASLAHDFPDEVQFRGLWGVSAALSGDTALARQRLGAEPTYRRGDYLAYLARYAGIGGDTERAIALWSEAVGAGVNGTVWIHASARRELIRIAKDPRFRRLGIIPDGRDSKD